MRPISILNFVALFYCEQPEGHERDLLVHEAAAIVGLPIDADLHGSDLADFMAEWGFPLCEEWERED